MSNFNDFSRNASKYANSNIQANEQTQTKPNQAPPSVPATNKPTQPNTNSPKPK